MLPKLTDEMRRALQAQSDSPITVEDGVTQDRYVLLPLSIYERLYSIWNDDFDADDAAAAQSAVAGVAGWDDPEMDEYDEYDKFKAQL